jgi:hypothetical protein
LEKLLGKEYFLQTAKEYITRYPSRSSNLHDYGEYFPYFISEYPGLQHLHYLIEVAQFEWACHQLCFASEHTGLDIQQFKNISAQDYDKLHFNLHPASCLMKFSSPIMRIIELCQGDIDQEINMNEGGVNLLIIRRDQEIMLQPLTLSEYHFLNALYQGHPLAYALEIALQTSSNFKLDLLLPKWIQDKTLVEMYI